MVTRNHRVGVFNCQLPITKYQKGSFLVITLWLIAVLAMVAVALSRFLSTETRLIRYYGARAQARAWAEAGIRLGLQRLREDTNVYDGLGERWATPSPEDREHPTKWIVSFPKGSVSITITDEERRLNLNTATEEMLTAFLGNAEAAKALVRYRSLEDEGADQSMQPPYQPKNARLATLEEAFDIPAIRASSHVQQLIKEQGTVWTDAVNINTASAEVLKTLVPGVEPGTIDQVVAARPGPNGQLGDDDDCVAVDRATGANHLATCAGVGGEAIVTLLSSPRTVSSSVFRIHAEGETAQPMTRYQIEVIVKRQGEEEPVILAWRER